MIKKKWEEPKTNKQKIPRKTIMKSRTKVEGRNKKQMSLIAMI